MAHQCGVALSVNVSQAAVAMETVTMEVTQPSTVGPVCSGQEVTLTCTVTQTGDYAVVGF